MRDRARISSVLIATMLLMLVPAVHATAANGEMCVVNSDSQASGAGFDRADLLSVVDVDDFDPATNETVIGLTGTDWIEAIQFGPGGVLYAADEERFGVVDVATGAFSAASRAYGSGDGALGSIRFHDIDGLAFAPDGRLFGSMRRTDEAPDLLLVIDPATGAHVPDAFGAGGDYVVVEAPASDRTLWDVDDLAFIGQTLYAIVNLDGHRDRLVTIDPATGATTDIGATGQRDMEGLTTSLSGRHLWGVTGDANDAAIWHIDPASGAASAPRYLDDADDYEGITCRSMAPPVQPATVTVVPGACVFEDGASSTPVNVTITPAGAATVTLRTGGGTLVQRFHQSGSIDVGPGSFIWTATAADGFTLTGPAQGRFVARACAPPTTEVGVAVVLGPCVPTAQGSRTDVSINVTVPGAATLVLTDASGATVLTTDRSTTAELPPGSYAWTATPTAGFTLVGPREGGLTVEGCDRSDATVSVDAGSCEFREDLGRFRVPLTVDIQPAGAATVTIERITGPDVQVGRTDEPGAFDVPGGNTYRWTAVAKPGFALTGPTSGEIEVETCVLPAIAVSVTCVVDDASGEARAQVRIPGGDATVTLASDQGFHSVFGATTTTGVLPDGSYSWTAAGEPGFTVTQPRSGGFTVDADTKVCGLAITGSSVDLGGVGRIGWAALFIGAVLALAGRLRIGRPIPLPTTMGTPLVARSWVAFRQRPRAPRRRGWSRVHGRVGRSP